MSQNVDHLDLLEHEGLYTFEPAPTMLVKARFTGGRWELSVPVERPDAGCWRTVAHLDDQGEVWFVDDTFEHVPFPVAPTFVDLTPHEPDPALWGFADDETQANDVEESSAVAWSWLAFASR